MSENDKTLTEEAEKEVVSRNFIEQIIDKDLAEGVYDTVNTRFPRSQTVICISGMRRVSCSIQGWRTSMAVNLICVLTTRILQRRKVSL